MFQDPRTLFYTILDNVPASWHNVPTPSPLLLQPPSPPAPHDGGRGQNDTANFDKVHIFCAKGLQMIVHWRIYKTGSIPALQYCLFGPIQ